MKNSCPIFNFSPGVPWTVIDKSYITSLPSKEAPISWEKFLSVLGVVHFLAIERKDVAMSKSNLVSSLNLNEILKHIH